jgi:hypothetical protein
MDGLQRPFFDVDCGVLSDALAALRLRRPSRAESRACLHVLALLLGVTLRRGNQQVRANSQRPLAQAHPPDSEHRCHPWRGLRRRSRLSVARSALSHPRLRAQSQASQFGIVLGGWARAADAGSVAALAAAAAVS